MISSNFQTKTIPQKYWIFLCCFTHLFYLPSNKLICHEYISTSSTLEGIDLAMLLEFAINGSTSLKVECFHISNVEEVVDSSLWVISLSFSYQNTRSTLT